MEIRYTRDNNITSNQTTMSSYHHFTQKDRTELAFMLREGYDQVDMAGNLNKCESAVSREFSRNKDPITEIYHAGLAQKNADRRRKNKSIPGSKIANNDKLNDEVETRLKKYHSPEQIEGALRKEHGKTIVSKDTIYAYIDNFAPYLQKYLRFAKNHYRRKKGTKAREKQREKDKKRRIDQRPEEVEERKEIGHWEGDTVWSLDKKHAIVTLVERVAGMSLSWIVNGKTIEEVNKAIIHLFSSIPQGLRLSLTLDNGSEFAGFEELEKALGIIVYFAYPYHSWERGCNENFNGLLRQFFPKKTNFNSNHQSKLKYYNNLLNNRPRKRLGYLTPLQVFSSCTS